MEKGEEVVEETQEDKRQQGIRIKLPGGTTLEIRGLTTIMALLLVLTGLNTWIGWTLVTQMSRVGDSMLAQARAQNLQTCMMLELDPAKRRERYEECVRWFKRECADVSHSSPSPADRRKLAAFTLLTPKLAGLESLLVRADCPFSNA